MNITVIVPPPFEPVTLAEVYKQLRLDPDISSSPVEISHPDDSLLAGYIQTAREFAETALRRALVQQTLRLSCGGFPSHCQAWRGAGCRIHEVVERVLLRRPPLIRVERGQFYDGANQLQTVDSTDYFVTDDLVPELRFTDGFATPTLYARPDALRVEYVAGYAPEGSPPTTQEEFAATVPQTFKDAILIGVQLLYDNLSTADREAMENMRTALLQTKRIQLV